MTPAQNLLKMLVDASEGTRKAGFTAGGVTYTLDQGRDLITGTFTIPISIVTDGTTGALKAEAQDFLELAPPPAPAPTPAPASAI
jgi:hypothetical protein